MRVGSNTFPNLAPLLTGRTFGSFPLINNRLSYCDSMPLLWSEGALKHYATIYSENRADISTFNSLMSGFYHTPTDFYFRPYNLAMDLFTPLIMDPVNGTGNFGWPCYSNKDNFTVQVDHFKGFLNRFKGKLKFSFFWANAAHESFSLLQYTDNTLLSLLKWMQDNGHSNHSVIAVLSDHGLRLEEFSTTHAGRLERQMPFLSMFVPPSLKRKYPWIDKNLMHNSKGIVTHFDVHKSVIDIAKGNFDDTTPPLGESHVARNVFSAIPETRTCVDAGIPQISALAKMT